MRRTALLVLLAGSLIAGRTAAALPPEVRSAVQLSDCHNALQALPSERSDEARLVEGWCAARSGKVQTAAQALSGLGPTLAPYGALILARAHSRAEQHVAALATVGPALALPGSAGREAALIRGRSLVHLKRSLEAREGLRDLLPDPELGAEARYWLALGGEQRGEREAALATWRRTWIDTTTGPWGERAAARMAELGHPVPDVDSAAGRATAMERMRALRQANQHGAALELLRQVHARDPAVAGALEMAQAAFRGRDYPAAIRRYAALLGEPDEAGGAAQALFDYALAHARTGDYDTATTIYRRVMAQHPGSSQADTASYKIGYMAFDAGDDEGARALLRSHVDALPHSEHYDEALWFAARAAWRSGDVQGATELWDWIIHRRSARSLIPGARYWKARAAGRQGDVKAEQEGLQAVLERHPVSGYAWLAAQRLGHRFEPVPPVAAPALSADLASQPRVHTATRLLDAGQSTWARELLEDVQAEERAERLALAHLLIRAGAYRAGRALAAPSCVKPWRGGDPLAQQACTPRPEHALVSRVAARYGLDPQLPYAIMTAESALRPGVTSIAGARGLMQLMPAEGPRVHAALFAQHPDPPPFEADDLYRPAYNAAMGSTELGQKQRSLAGVLQGSDLPAVIASYNGGEAAVRRWLEAWSQPPPADEFIEDIGYTETRRYVRRVLGFLMAYRWVYGPPEPSRASARSE